MRVVWISGWGVSPGEMQSAADSFPAAAEHMFFAPTSAAPGLATAADHVVAWSFGAQRVLQAAAQGRSFSGRVWLLAPFLDFCREHGQGSRCSAGQVRWLRRWLLRDAPGALQDFHQRAGLPLRGASGLPYPMEDLLEGLDRLGEPALAETRAFAARGLPSRWTAVVGDTDPLLDGEAICRVLPGCHLAKRADHHFMALFSAAREVAGAL